MAVSNGWRAALKRGLSGTRPSDPLAGEQAFPGLRVSLKRLWPAVRRHWRLGALGSGLIVATTLLGFPQPLIARHLVDRVILGRPVHPLGALTAIILLLVAVTLAEKVIQFFQRFACTRFELETLLDIQHGLFEHVLRLPKAFFDKNDTGYLMSRLSSDVQGLRWFFSGTMVHLATNTLRLAGGLAMLLYLEWRLGLGVLALLPCMFLCVRFFAARTHGLGHRFMEEQALVSGRLQESLSGVSLIKAFTTEKRAAGQIVSGLKETFRTSLEQITVNSAATVTIGVLPGLVRAVVLGLGAAWIMNGQWTLGSLLAFQLYLGFVFGPIQYLAASNLQLQQARASLERVLALFDIVPEIRPGTGREARRLEGRVEFRNVTFSYDGRKPVLDSLSFHVQPGAQVTIVGPSGVGKTTLLSLLLRFYKPTSGEVLFDGRPAGEYDLASLRGRIGYVAQSTLLVSGTVMENLRYGNPDAEDREVLEAAKAAGAHEFIAALPEGYKTRIGAGGTPLSAGENQRLALARALVKDPDILVLDEPTAALDTRTEKSVLAALPPLVRGKTLFVVAHDPATARHSDLILLLDESRLVAGGTHKALLATSPEYRAWLQLPPGEA